MFARVGKSGVYDGDTAHLDIRLDQATALWFIDRRCRLARINAPELKQAGGPEARTFLASLLDGFILDATFAAHLDDYGRPLVELVLPDGRNVSDVLLAGGYAAPYQRG